jgi:hypothetical protein
LHFLQLTSKENLIRLQQWGWKDSHWISQEPTELHIQNREVPTSIVAEVSLKGNLLLSILVNDIELSDLLQSSVIAMSESLGLSQEITTPFPAIIVPTQSASAMTEDTATWSTPTSSVSAMSGSSLPSYKNLVGFLVLSGILILLGLIFRPLHRKQKSSE